MLSQTSGQRHPSQIELLVHGCHSGTSRDVREQERVDELRKLCDGHLFEQAWEVDGDPEGHVYLLDELDGVQRIAQIEEVFVDPDTVDIEDLLPHRRDG